MTHRIVNPTIDDRFINEVPRFFGGWLPPFQGIKALHAVPGFVWYLVKIMFFLYLYVWIRATFPRYRFDSLIRLVWKWFIPLALANLLVVILVRFLR